MANLITVESAAATLGRDSSGVRRECVKHDLGVLVNPRCRLLTPADLKKLARIFSEKKVGGARPGAGRPPATA